MAPPKKKQKMSPVNCPYCNVPRVARLVTLENSEKILCSSPSCKREIYSESLNIPAKIRNSPLYLNEYIQNFKSIGSGLVILGTIQATYNVRLSEVDTGDLGVTDIVSALTAIHRNQVYSYKVAVSYGRLLSKMEDGEDEQVKYFHSSSNNSSLFSYDDHYNSYWLVDSESAFKACIDEIHDRVKEDTHRPHTKWTLVGNVNASITLLRSSAGEMLMGKLKTVPLHLRQHGMSHFHRHPKSKRVIVDNLCFFRCLSFFLYKNLSHVDELFHRVYGEANINLFEGVKMSEMRVIEAVFQIRIQVYKLCKRKKACKGERKVYVKFVRNSLSNGDRVMNLNLHKNHLSLIVDMKKYGELFMCSKCKRVFASNFNLKRHTGIKKECTRVNFVYKGGVYNPKKTIFQKLAEYNIETTECPTIYPYRIVFDFESYFTKSRTDKMRSTEIELDHKPLSASVSSDFPGYTEPVCFVREDNKADNPLVNTVLEYINELGILIGMAVRKHFHTIIQALDKLIKEHMAAEETALKLSGLKRGFSSKLPVQTLKCEVLNYIKRVPVIGFNSGRYDLNLIKREFHTFFSSKDSHEITTIKRCNQYIAVYTEHLVFLDIFNYLAPGYTYANYLKAFVGDTAKGIFPYSWMDSVRKLKCKTLPPRAAFYNSLTCQHITLEDYKSCQKVWREKKMVTFKDYLIHYNNLDVAPFVKAIKAHSKFFIDKSVDMFKDGLTLPGLTLKFLFQNSCKTATPYVLFSKREQDLHNLVRKNLVGGPSIIFHRHHLSGVSKIRERLYGEKSEVSKHILGIDANSLYLKCMGEAHCTGFYVVRRCEDNFKPICSQRVSYSATEWLRYRAYIDQVDILHQYNYGEVCLGGKRIHVDGFVPERKLVYQFHGCYWHGHVCHLTKSVLKTEAGKTWVQKKAENTAQITLYLKGLGYTVIEEYECRWLVLKEQPSCYQFKKHWAVKKPETKQRLSERDILDGVQTGSIFGMIQVDIHTPEHLKPLFEEMTPIFKNALVSREDVGPHMKEFLESHDRLKKPQRQLIGSFYGEKILFGTPLLQWYLQKGLVVSKVYLLVEYTPEHTFEPFVKQVTEARRLGDKNVECKILSDLYKLLGNSSYGKTICNKQNFLKTRYVSPKRARNLVLHWSVQQVHDISENTVELSCLPSTVVYDLPTQIGFMVYQYAKLKMLAFYYDFLVKFIDKRKFELCEMDTDSYYFVLSEKKLDDAVYPNMREEYFTERHLWLPSESCDIQHHRETYIACRTNNYPWFPQPCCESRLVYDKRTPGLFKVEWEGTEMTSLNSKCYLGRGENCKLSCKGVIQKQNPLSSDTYNNVLHTRGTHMVTNKGFKVVDHHMVTYTQVKKGLNYQYIKRKICDDGVSTVPLDI
jgi:G:T-mismatch repair DNA endonuclease (very short patch repair protein)